jgi:hypothetical protein
VELLESGIRGGEGRASGSISVSGSEVRISAPLGAGGSEGLERDEREGVYCFISPVISSRNSIVEMRRKRLVGILGGVGVDMSREPV